MMAKVKTEVEMKMTNVRLPETTAKWLKLLAYQTGKSVSVFIDGLVKAHAQTASTILPADAKKDLGVK